MGNNHSNQLATPHVAKYMRLTKHQVMDLHIACKQLARGTRCFSRNHFHAALQHAKITSVTDRDILTLLCTMWDLKGDGKVPCLDYSLSLAPLCCPGESMEQVLQFCFAIIDTNDAVTSQETVLILKSICATAAYFGDETFTVRQLYKIVDQVFDSMTIMTETTEALEHWMVAKKLGEHPLVIKLLCNPKNTKRSIDKNQNNEEDEDEERSILNAQYAPNYHHHAASGQDQRKSTSTGTQSPSKFQNKPFALTRLENCSTTDVSSVMLSPLIQIPVGRDSVSNF
ncbi:hypothetical protein FisN_5Lh015 [Fistulifera solaris]|uniref:EF-hand domain-containing protein n=1 Tax=Fistulifera solaris TaxID=1519565 RepID=A0A1Z5JJ74_FISSO|nr:hypothetical protein FisN_5Lh015 [Fistulifera solaris]|eukprot:GAX14055.1 hypothetical protein FisN_5Lh015 [Fistulifera solaris]